MGVATSEGLLSHRKGLPKERLGLRVGAASMKISASGIEKLGQFHRAWARKDLIAKGQHMRQQHGTARPNAGFIVRPLWKSLGEPVRHSFGGQFSFSAAGEARTHSGLHKPVQGDSRLTAIQFNMLSE